MYFPYKHFLSKYYTAEQFGRQHFRYEMYTFPIHSRMIVCEVFLISILNKSHCIFFHLSPVALKIKIYTGSSWSYEQFLSCTDNLSKISEWVSLFPIGTIGGYVPERLENDQKNISRQLHCLKWDIQGIKKTPGLTPPANYTDRATATCRS
jgi:hypothetical protein